MHTSDAIDDLIHNLPDADGLFDAQRLRMLHRLGAKRKAVVLAFPPKAAGTFLRAAIIKAIDGQLVRIVHAQAGRDATPYLPILLRYYEGGLTDKTLVTHVHMLALPANLHLLAAFGIRPIVMARNIPDMLASYWDMLDTDNGALQYGLNCHIPPRFRSLPRNAKADFLVDVLAPWYVNFYAGWFAHAARSPESVFLIDYHNLQSSPVETLAAVLKHAGVAQDIGVCRGAIEATWEQRDSLRFNKGENGRGADYFRPPHLNRIGRMLGHYPVLADWRHLLLESSKTPKNAYRS